MTESMPDKIPVGEFVIAIRNLHGLEALWLGSEPVTELFQGEVAWQGRVQIFIVTGHPEASRCYCWSHAQEGTDKRRVVCVLGVPPVDTPRAAVRAAIAADEQGDG